MNVFSMLILKGVSQLFHFLAPAFQINEPYAALVFSLYKNTHDLFFPI